MQLQGAPLQRWAQAGRSTTDNANEEGSHAGGILCLSDLHVWEVRSSITRNVYQFYKIPR